MRRGACLWSSALLSLVSVRETSSKKVLDLFATVALGDVNGTFRFDATLVSAEGAGAKRPLRVDQLQFVFCLK